MRNRLHTLFSKYLEKVGVKDFTELDPEERATYDRWQETLQAEVTLEDIAAFIKTQQEQLGKNLQTAVREGHDREAILITARLENYNDLHAVIAAPDRNRETLADSIENLIKTIKHE